MWEHTCWGVSGADLHKPLRRFLECVRMMGVESMATISSVRVSFTGSPVAWREMQSVARCLIPGTWTIQNLYRRVFSFKFLRRAFEISSRLRSLKILSRSLWSTAIMRSLHPRTKYLALSRVSATARASPSTGAKCDSAGWVNLLPTSVITEGLYVGAGTVFLQ